MNLVARFAPLALALIAANAGAAVGTLIPASPVNDMVYDPGRDIVYIANGTRVLRYSVSGGAFLAPVQLSGKLRGIDLSPDGKTIAVANGAYGTSGGLGKSWVDLIDADTLVDTKSVTNYKGINTGTYSVAYATNGDMLATLFWSSGSGWGPILRHLANGTWENVTDARGGSVNIPTNSLLGTTGDGKTFTYNEAYLSPGSWGTVVAATNAQATYRTDGQAIFDLAADAVGSQFVAVHLPGAGPFTVYGTSNQVLATIGSDTSYPLGVAYHPVKALAYLPWAGTSDVRVYYMDTFQLKTTYHMVAPFVTPDEQDLVRTRLSPDGSLLMVAATAGVEIYRMYAPLAAADVSASTVAGHAVRISAAGSIGTTGTLVYSVGTAPAHGTATVSGKVVTYRPAPHFVGTDTLAYQVAYGRATATATMTVTVNPSGAMMAGDDAATVRGSAPVQIPVLANDRDPDGLPMSINVVTQPRHGHVSIQGDRIVFAPSGARDGTESFAYTIGNGHGGSARARVSVRTTR